jgi:parallel beta-helix repeat protein
VYNRGQDSAGILVYEQSNGNLFYKNNVTHGGDGFFLWAGQTTMDSGKGGCNDNVLKENDFSYAPTNGIEVTFSRNMMLRNRIYECDHGIWGGYSFESRISDNRFRDNRIAIAIEHGQNNIISHNTFEKDKTAIRLWARAQQPADWGYAKYRDTRSHNYIIAANSFNANPLVFDLQMTDSIAIFSNRYSDTTILFREYNKPLIIDSADNEESMISLSREIEIDIPEVKSPKDPFKGAGKLAGRKNIMITEWGPYNFGYPIIWNTNPTDTSAEMKFNLFGPAGGKWKIISMKGFEKPDRMSGSFPDSLFGLTWKAGRRDLEILVEYTGPAFIDQFGKPVPANKPHRFKFRKFFQPIDFQVSWYRWDSASNPVKDTAFIAQLQKEPPVRTEQVNKLDYAWWGGIRDKDNKQHPQFLTIAEGSANIAPGTYELAVTWDDAVKVYVDGKLVLNEWNPSKYTFDESPNRKITLKLGGNHTFRVVHAELGGFATLSLKLNKLN